MVGERALCIRIRGPTDKTSRVGTLPIPRKCRFDSCRVTSKLSPRPPRYATVPWWLSVGKRAKYPGACDLSSSAPQRVLRSASLECCGTVASAHSAVTAGAGVVCDRGLGVGPPHGHWVIVRIFAFFGLGVMFGRDQTSALVGAPFAALGINILWRLWIAIRAGIRTLWRTLYTLGFSCTRISAGHGRASLLTQPMQSAQWMARPRTEFNRSKPFFRVSPT